MARKQYDIPTERDPIAEELTRRALERPVEEQEPLDLPRPKPIEELERTRLKPVAKQSKRRQPSDEN